MSELTPDAPISDRATAPGPAVPGDPAPKPTFWTRTKVIISVAVGAASLITGIISVYPILTRDPSNFSHLRLQATPVADGVSEWAISPEALALDYPAPAAGAASCGEAQLAWLEANGTPLDRRFQLDLRNTAKEGAILALVEFRTTAEPPEQRGQPQIRAVCDSRTQQAETIYYERFDADNPDAVARHVKLTRGDLEQAPSLASTYNLAPGASEQAIFELFSRYPAEGTISVTALSGEEEQVFEVEGSAFSLPPLLFSGEMYLTTGTDGLTCIRLDAGSIQACTLDDVRREAATAQQ